MVGVHRKNRDFQGGAGTSLRSPSRSDKTVNQGQVMNRSCSPWGGSHVHTPPTDGGIKDPGRGQRGEGRSHGLRPRMGLEGLPTQHRQSLG